MKTYQHFCWKCFAYEREPKGAWTACDKTECKDRFEKLCEKHQTPTDKKDNDQ